MKIIKNKNWDALHQQFQWVRDMETTPQSEVYHAEGNVAIHTQMVLFELQKMEEFNSLTEMEQEILWTAALFHDVEKRSTTIMEDGAIISPGHAKKGAVSTRQILFEEISVPFHIREEIVNLVRYHGLPVWIFEKGNPQRELYECSLHCNTRLLAILAKADMLGRVCEDKEKMLERIEFFIEYCKEQECFGVPKKFADNLTRFKYFSKGNIDVHYPVFDDTICEVVIMSGLPGMGKDAYISKNFKDLPIISLDDIRQKYKIKPTDKKATGWVVQHAKEQARQYLRAKHSFVWNATNITIQIRSIIISLMIEYNARVRLIYIEQPYKVWSKQNENRLHSVPEEVMQKLLRKLEVPSLHEAVDVEYIV